MVHEEYHTGMSNDSVLGALYLYCEAPLQAPVRLEIRLHRHDK